jgi:hypothetical protein
MVWRVANRVLCLFVYNKYTQINTDVKRTLSKRFAGKSALAPLELPGGDLIYRVESRFTPISGPTWFRRGQQSRTVHTEAWLPRKYTHKSIVANDENYALAA